jgi:hypothetical protein
MSADMCSEQSNAVVSEMFDVMGFGDVRVDQVDWTRDNSLAK